MRLLKRSFSNSLMYSVTLELFCLSENIRLDVLLVTFEKTLPVHVSFKFLPRVYPSLPSLALCF